MAMPVPEQDRGSEGAAATALVRPHEVRLSKATSAHDHDSDGAPRANASAIARVERLVFVGAHARAVLRLSGGGGELIVDLSYAELESLGIKEGDRVMADLQEAKIFVGDYAI
jgi:sulfate transport system ATP-binding protein